ncbi:MAG: class I SAM-dependent methyltransferase [Planctomycetes bacterium]|nr:class I SAM-dependent methyltransferase [Planctomycetota bacterium]
MRTGTTATGCDAQFLDRSLAHVDAGRIELGLEILYEGLIDTREKLSLDEWRRFSEEIVLRHPMRERIHQDPVALRSFEKPRGYAGDAVLLDYIYGRLGPSPDAPLARAIYEFGKTRPACRGVCRRKTILADTIDRIAESLGRPIRVLSVASGHLREAQDSRAYREGGIEEFVGLDADPESCAAVERQLPDVTVVHAPFVALYRDPRFDPRFDFIYSAGLYDYLKDSVAEKLSARLFHLLAPGGTLLLTNFLTSCVDAAYMESFMAWELIYRTRQEVEAFARRIPEAEIGERRSFVDSHRAIGYLELTRA